MANFRLVQRIILDGNPIEEWYDSDDDCCLFSLTLSLSFFLSLFFSHCFFNQKRNFTFGFVMPDSTNTWSSSVDAAPREQMLTPEAINGKLSIETKFFDDKKLILKSVISVFYD